MKKIINIVLVIILCAGIWFALSYYNINKEVTREEFLKETRVINLKLDSLERISNIINLKTDSINDNVKEIKLSIDTLKKGQSIIYEQVKKSNNTFWEMFK